MYRNHLLTHHHKIHHQMFLGWKWRLPIEHKYSLWYPCNVSALSLVLDITEAWEATVPRRAEMSDNILATWESNTELQPCPGNMETMGRFINPFENSPTTSQKYMKRWEILEGIEVQASVNITSEKGHNQNIWPKSMRLWRASPKLVYVTNTWRYIPAKRGPFWCRKREGMSSNLQINKRYPVCYMPTSDHNKRKFTRN